MLGGCFRRQRQANEDDISSLFLLINRRADRRSYSSEGKTSAYDVFGFIKRDRNQEPGVHEQTNLVEL